MTTPIHRSINLRGYDKTSFPYPVRKTSAYSGNAYKMVRKITLKSN